MFKVLGYTLIAIIAILPINSALALNLKSQCDFKNSNCIFIPANVHNFFRGRENHKIKLLILHYTATNSLRSTIEGFKNPKQQTSSHYIINTNGQIIQMVSEQDTARHAGKKANSYFDGKSDINNSTIGVEIVNRGYTKGDYPNLYPMAQILALKKLCDYLIKKYNIKPWFILGHSDVAIGRKFDPGPYFPWQDLAQSGIGLYPIVSTNTASITTLSNKLINDMLQKYGYNVSNLANSKKAFQLHFNPNAYIKGIAFGRKDISILQELLKVKGVSYN